MSNLKVLNSDTPNLFAQQCKKYLDKGISVIPDRFMGKTPAIKGWSDYCYRRPNEEEIKSWCSNFMDKGSNIAVALGEASGIIALDLDTVDKKVLDLILPVLPESPVEKKGSKGFTRFFKYNGESTQILKHNGEVVLEVLSNNKKTTIPPSIHPNGSAYIWTSEKELSDINKADLPLLPPYLMSHIESKLKLHIPDLTSNGTKGTFSGRNSELSTLCGSLIKKNTPVDMAVKELINFDKQNHSPPLFSDPEEMPHTEPFTNALAFYTNHLSTANNRHFKNNEEYEIPITASAVNMTHAEELEAGKSQRLENEKKSNLELPHAQGVLKTIYDNILSNSFIPQPEFAFSAALIAMSTLIGRKLVFQGMAPNLYILNIAPSGSGKDAPQQKLKEYFCDIGAEYLLGSGDYVSDASLMDGLDTKPVRLDIMDEAGGILRSVNSGKSDYNGKMADILAEMYTSSNSKYLGRSTAEGNKGSCFRPNVNVLASTTPTGFSEGVSVKAIEKGLMGRFLTFLGDNDKKAQRVKNFTKLDLDTMNKLRYWAGYKPEESDMEINGIPQAITEVRATEAGNARLDELFEIFDNQRRSTDHSDPTLPIIARLYQQMVKIVLIHSASRCRVGNTPVVDIQDVDFGYKSIMFYFENIKTIVKKYIHDGPNAKNYAKMLNIVREEGTISKKLLSRRTRYLRKHERDSILQDLVETGELVVDVIQNESGLPETVVRIIG